MHKRRLFVVGLNTLAFGKAQALVEIMGRDADRVVELQAFATLPLRRQDAHTRMRLVVAPTLAWTGRRLMFQRRLLTL